MAYREPNGVVTVDRLPEVDIRDATAGLLLWQLSQPSIG